MTGRLGEDRLAVMSRGSCRRCAMATRPVTVNDVLVGHVALDLECFDRIYLNGCPTQGATCRTWRSAGRW